MIVLTPIEVMRHMIAENNLRVSLNIYPCLTPSYSALNKKITLSIFVAVTPTPICFLLALHEVGHAIQHHRWPVLFALRKWWIVGYWVTLFLEYDASRRAIDFMNAAHIVENYIELANVKKEAFEGFKSYL